MTKTNLLCGAASLAVSLAFTVACGDSRPETIPDEGTGGGESTGGASAATGGESSSGTGGNGLFGPCGNPLGDCPDGTGGGFEPGGGGELPKGESCPIPGPMMDSFAPSGYMGDQSVLNAIDCPGDLDRPEGARGDCSGWNTVAGTGGDGWAGVMWLHPYNLWNGGDANAPGCDVPADAVLKFKIRGAVGGEVVSFGGSDVPGDVGKKENLVLTTEWVEYSVPIGTATTAPNMQAAFNFTVGGDGQGGTFYFDDFYIESAGGGMGGATQ